MIFTIYMSIGNIFIRTTHHIKPQSTLFHQQHREQSILWKLYMTVDSVQTRIYFEEASKSISQHDCMYCVFLPTILGGRKK